MNKATLTSKTGLTAVMSVIMTGLGMYTGAVPIVGGAQTIITGLLALFLRDSVTTATAATEENTRQMQQQTIELKNAALATPPALRASTYAKSRDNTDGAGA